MGRGRGGESPIGENLIMGDNRLVGMVFIGEIIWRYTKWAELDT